jgi:hypothetical protein
VRRDPMANRGQAPWQRVEREAGERGAELA